MKLIGRIFNYKGGCPTAILGLVTSKTFQATVTIALGPAMLPFTAADNTRRFAVQFQQKPKAEGGLYKRRTQRREVIVEDGIVKIRDFPNNSRLLSDTMHIRRKQ